MARGQRKKVMRKTASVYCNLEDACAHLYWLKEVFSKPHPELAEALDAIGIQIAGAMLMIEEFWRATQGELPSDWRKMARW